ncbi:MAG: choice-of-anchor tandem repeat GloVer-containing protein [Candidatus Cybelea sp.]
MKSLGFGRVTLCSCVAAAVLAGCGGSQPPIGAPSATPQSRVSGRPPVLVHHMTGSLYDVAYRFHGASKNDGASPVAGLIDVDGTLYGTTHYGGSGCGSEGCGTVYSATTSGREKVLYRFSGGSDGAYPQADLVDVTGTLYGTTNGGGNNSCAGGCGTVFSIGPNGTEKVLHSFTWADGAYPQADLIEVNGALYGTTSRGSGCDLCGNVFRISTTGKLKVLHSFSGEPDGAIPLAGLIDVNGTLYGTTAFGGSGCSSQTGCGTVFSITTAGMEKVLHRFSSDPDGAFPQGDLIDVNGTLYGTTFSGGKAASECYYPGCGTIFSISMRGKEKVLYSFICCTDGHGPVAGMLDTNGILYGTTLEGGSYGCGHENENCGTIFSVNTSGSETVLHSFGAPHDGAMPHSGLVNVNSTLYGTTRGGGSKCGRFGCGTVFAFSP